MNLSSKNLFWSLINLVLVAALIFGVKELILRPPLFLPDRTITVSAEGKAVVAPDLAALSFSVITEGRDPKVIQTENAEKMNSAIEFVKSQGVDAKDIKTANYNLYPRYDYIKESPLYPGGRQVLAGYTLTQTVIVKVRDFSKVAAILAGLPERGINQIESVSFDVEDPDRYLNEARKEAFQKARAKANEMASYNGVRIRRVVNFSESLGGYPMPYQLEAFGKGGDVGVPVPPPAIEPGTQEVNVQVSVTYEIR